MSATTATLPAPLPLSAPALREADTWAAVVARDAAQDGRFVFAVATTGVYCRPSCPARRPRRENVRFFATPADARLAGYRACRRCRPDEDAPGRGAEAVAAARAYLDAHADRRVPLAELARVAGLSPHHLQRTFTRVVGVSPRAYAEARRAGRFRERLRAGDTVSRAAFEAGYGSGSRAYAAADAHLGMSPGAYRRGAPRVTIRYATADCTLGRVLVAATERGVCAVQLADDDAALVAELAREFPRAALEAVEEDALAADAPLAAALAAVRAAVESPGDAAEAVAAVPLDVAGSPFQRRVWDALRAIPTGETRSYGAVAAALGAPTAARAVARACATNRVALLVPCHRVLRGEGAVGGYRWGAPRKRALLERERGAPPHGR
jgi:AraC family transcriptional regulator of adaptative response/methylated-DNA-[protein]-cysteine methyltransferase